MERALAWLFAILRNGGGRGPDNELSRRDAELSRADLRAAMNSGRPAIFRVNQPCKDYRNQNFQHNHESRPEQVRRIWDAVGWR
jgi:hypothetical protein